MNPSGAPSPEEQLTFLARIQRLFAEGDFTATYKFALLIAMADLAVELGADDGAELVLDQQTLGRKFIELYWQQAAPYGLGDGASAVLAQNVGEQAAVVKAIVEFRRAYPASTRQSAATQPGYADLVRRVASTVFAQPVKYLQNLGGQTDEFLFERMRGAIRLKPGIAFCLRRFQILIQQLARKSWIDHIKGNRRNLAVLGETSDLESFLFDTPRSTLEIIRRGLTQLTGPKCFYCQATLREADVDHFIPFSLYPRDLSHNFVLSDPRCNRSKSNSLAARSHLERWREHIDRHDIDLREIGAQAGLPGSLTSSLAVATWGYSNAAHVGARAWAAPGDYEAITRSYLELLAA